MTYNEESGREEFKLGSTLFDLAKQWVLIGVVMFLCCSVFAGLAVYLALRGNGWWVASAIGSSLGFLELAIHGGVVLRDRVQDLKTGPIEVAGTVTEKFEIPYGDAATPAGYEVTVSGRRFQVPLECYFWLSEGDEVVVEYYPRSEHVAKVTRTRSLPQQLDAEPAIA